MVFILFILKNIEELLKTWLPISHAFLIWVKKKKLIKLIKKSHNICIKSPQIIDNLFLDNRYVRKDGNSET